MRYSILVLALAVTACDFRPLASDSDSVNPLKNYAVTAFDPNLNPRGYRTALYYPEWWAAVESCSGLSGDLSAVHWYYITNPETRSYNTTNGLAGASYIQSEHAILLTQAVITDQHIVEHEMLHALIGRGGHPAVFDRCGLRF